MSNYFDNQTKWEWKNDGEKVIVTTEHNHPKVHSHTMDITNVPIEEMIDNPGKVMGEAHRSVPHEYKNKKTSIVQKENKTKENSDMSEREDFLESLKVNKETLVKLDQVMKNYNNDSKKTKNDDGGREIGDEGLGKLGREPGLKSGNNVSNMRADMKAHFNANISKGQLNQNGQIINHSEKIASSTVMGQNFSGKTSITANNGQRNSNNSVGNGHGNSHGTVIGSHRNVSATSASGYSSFGGSHSGFSGSSEGGHSGSSGSSGGGHGGSSGSSGGSSGSSGGGHGSSSGSSGASHGGH